MQTIITIQDDTTRRTIITYTDRIGAHQTREYRNRASAWSYLLSRVRPGDIIHRIAVRENGDLSVLTDMTVPA